MPQARWSSLLKAPLLARSSHCITVTNAGTLIVYGGELKPRTPVDTGSENDPAPCGSLHVFDLAKSLSSSGWRTLAPDTAHVSSADTGTVTPTARVGAATVWHGNDLYMWGGRGGTDMAPLDTHQAGIWKATIDWAKAVQWERISAVNEEEAPESRSYHTAVSHGDNIYIHAGCPTSGRLSTLHAFNVAESLWKPLAAAPYPGRGGTALVATTIAGAQDVLLRFGGFCGHQLPSGGEVDIYIISEDKWITVKPAADPAHGVPAARSVHGFARYQSSHPELSNAVAVVYHGERETSNLGHAGAGNFWDDVWTLSKDPAQDVAAGWAWRKVDVAKKEGLPEGRGWFPPVSWVDGAGDTKVIMFGGLLTSNTRADELWELEIS